MNNKDDNNDVLPDHMVTAILKAFGRGRARTTRQFTVDEAAQVVDYFRRVFFEFSVLDMVVDGEVVLDWDGNDVLVQADDSLFTHGPAPKSVM